jgi:hypothetical protein
MPRGGIPACGAGDCAKRFDGRVSPGVGRSEGRKMGRVGRAAAWRVWKRGGQ